MGKTLTHRHLPRTLHELFAHSDEWRRRMDRMLDRVEKFASTVGNGYVNRVDAGLLALGSGLFALIALAYWQ